MKHQAEILVYITDKPERIITGNSLCLHMAPGEERDLILADIGRALLGNVVTLKNGDVMIISNP